MGVVQSNAMLYQLQRKIDVDGRIVAAIGDYEFAWQLCRGPLARLLGGKISDAAIRFHAWLAQWAEGGFSTTEAYQSRQVTDTAARGWLHELAGIGAVEQTSESKGSRAARWKLTSMPASEVAAGGFDLPDPSEIKK